MSKHNEVAIMFSGGLDSFIASMYAEKNAYEATRIYVNLGHPYAESELAAIAKTGLDVEIVDMKTLYPLIQKRMTNQIIPSRNMMLATIGSMFAPRVWLGVLEGEQNGKEHDKSKRFLRDSTVLLTFLNEFFQEETTVETPFAHMTKADIIGWALKNGASEEALLQTTSCYNHSIHGKPCGNCLTCYKRYVAFALNGVEEKGYVNGHHPLNSEYAKEIDAEMTKALVANDFSRFTRSRVEEWKKFKAL